MNPEYKLLLLSLSLSSSSLLLSKNALLFTYFIVVANFFFFFGGGGGVGWGRKFNNLSTGTIATGRLLTLSPILHSVHPCTVNPLRPNSDQQQFSPNDIHTLS